MNIKLSPKILDIVEVPNRLLGSETPGIAWARLWKCLETPVESCWLQ